MNQDAREGFVGHGERGGFAVFNGEILRGFVNLKALSGLDFHRIVVPGVQVHVDPARGIRNDGFHQSAVHSADFKLDVGNALGFVGLVDLDQLQASHGSIVEGQNLTLAFLDLNGLRCAVQHEPVHRGGFLRGDDRARFQIGENNAANFDKLIATIRSQEISASIILQSQSQLKSIYKDAADIISDNCDCTLFLSGRGKNAKEISDALGRETIDSYNTSENRGSQTSHGLNYQKLGKDVP